MIKVAKFAVNPLQENSLVVYDDSGECIFIDPGFYFQDEQNEIDLFINDNNLRPVKICNTHCHFDHIMGVEYIRSKYNIPFQVHEEDAFWISRAEVQGDMFGISMQPVKPADSFFQDGEIRFGNTILKVIHVPGHSPGHVVFYQPESGILIAGDVLFQGSIGRTDLPGGDYNTLISGIKNKLLELPGETKVYCGHGPETTIGFEKQNNPFLV